MPMRCPVLQLIAAAALAVFANGATVAQGFLTPANNHTKPGAAERNAPLHGARLVIVAAHHSEDIAWLDTVAQRCADCHVYVYTSSRKEASHAFHRGTIREVPNVGREWGKYLRFIDDEWPALQQTNATVIFMHAHQGSNSPDDDDRGDVASVLPRWPGIAADHILFLHGAETGISLRSPGDPLDYGSAICRLWPQLFANLGESPTADKDDKNWLGLFAISGAEFSVPARQLVRHPRLFYHQLEQWLMTKSPAIWSTSKARVSFDYAAGTILELLTYKIFQGGNAMNSDSHVFVQDELLQPPGAVVELLQRQ